MCKCRLSLILALGFTTFALAAPRLRIGVESADKPISFTDVAGRPDGFTSELLAEMGRAGLGDYEVVASNWTQLIAGFRAGHIDVLANVAATEDRRREMDLSISHAYVHGVIFSRPDRPRIRTTADFAGKTISALRGSTAHTNALDHGGWGATIKAITDPQAAIEEVRRGETDAMLLIYGLEGKYLKATQGLRREFVDDIIHQFRFAVHKGDTAALSRLNDALAIVRHNGAFDRIYDKWIGPIEPHPIRLSDLRPYAKSIVLGIIALATLIWWQRRMLDRVSRQAQALRESEERFRGLVDSAFEGWSIQQDGIIALVNSAFASTFGYTPAELTGMPSFELTPPANRSAVADAITSDRITPFETLGLRKDGTQIPIETSGRACTFKGKPARIVAVRDLTLQKKAANDQLVLSKLESTGILAGGIAHDFNNLLATMVLNVDMALLLSPAASESAQYLHDTKRAAESAKALTQQLITFAHGGMSVRQPTDLATFLRHTVPLALSGSNVRGDISTAADLWRPEIDVDQIERLINNLVLNAREAMPDGGVVTLRAENTLLAAGEIAVLPAGEYLRLDVVDHGHGIPAEVLPKIFDPYFSTKQRGSQKGMGLGLTLCHAIARQHGGAITVTSEVNVGTTFRVYLPATRKPVASAPATAATITPGSGRILVMDDEPDLRTALRLALGKLGHTVVLAEDGRKAVELYQQARSSGQPFDTVLLDLTVRSGMGGLAAMQLLRAFDPAVRAIVMSGYSQEPVLRDYARHGFIGALAKPFNLESLRRLLAADANG